jgi:hypothetical protein
MRFRHIVLIAGSLVFAQAAALVAADRASGKASRLPTNPAWIAAINGRGA